MALFRLGTLEVSPAAEVALAAVGVDASVFFERHGRGDWGEKNDWLHAENDAAARREASWHAIQSRYRPGGGTEVLVVTAPDRSRTRLQLASEYQKREVSALEGYAVWSSSYDAVPNPLIEVEEPAVAEILAALPPLRTAVDVGTGTGRLALWVARRGEGVHVTGFDASPEMLAIAAETARAEGLATVRFERAALEDGPLPEELGAFDLLTCGLMLCHVPDLRAAAAECARLVRPGGHLLITDFHPAAVAFGWRTACYTPAAYYFLPNAPHTRQDYLDAFAAAGCDLLDVRDIDLGGEPYGEVSEDTVRAKGLPPLCLVMLARKRGEQNPRSVENGSARPGVNMSP